MDMMVIKIYKLSTTRTEIVWPKMKAAIGNPSHRSES